MLNKKIIISFVTTCLLGGSLYAKPNEEERNNKVKHEKQDYNHEKNRDFDDKKIKHEKQKNSYDYDRDYNDKIKYEKQKELPSGLQKKLERGGTLPPGWQDKLAKGQIIDQSILGNGMIVTGKYPRIKNTEVYEVENKIFRIHRDTKEILDILK